MPFVRMSQVPLPPGCPGALRAAALRARVADALGPALAPHLVDAYPAGDSAEGALAIVLAGDRWEAARSELERLLAMRLGRPVEIRPGPHRADVSSHRGTPAPVDSPGPAERLRRVAERLAARNVDGLRPER